MDVYNLAHKLGLLISPFHFVNAKDLMYQVKQSHGLSCYKMVIFFHEIVCNPTNKGRLKKERFHCASKLNTPPACGLDKVDWSCHSSLSWASDPFLSLSTRREPFRGDQRFFSYFGWDQIRRYSLLYLIPSTVIENIALLSLLIFYCFLGFLCYFHQLQMEPTCIRKCQWHCCIFFSSGQVTSVSVFIYSWRTR